MNRLRLRAEGGFTLIELLVVIAIIGILAAIAIPQFAAYRRRGFESEAQSAVRNLTTAQEAYFVSHNKYGTGIGGLFTTFGFKQAASIIATTVGTVTDFTVYAKDTRCAAGGDFTFSNVSGDLKKVAACS